MDRLFNNNFHEAERGKETVERCYQLLRSSHKVVLIFPDDDSRVLRAAYKYLDIFLTSSHYDGAIVISSIDLDIDYMREITKVPLQYCKIDELEMNSVLRFASFICDKTLVKVISLKMPFNQKADDLVGFKDITVDHLVYYCLYDLLKGDDIFDECR